jgi:hypothetical protein
MLRGSDQNRRPDSHETALGRAEWNPEKQVNRHADHAGSDLAAGKI